MTFDDIKVKRREIEAQIAELQKKLQALDAVVEIFTGSELKPKGDKTNEIIEGSIPMATHAPDKTLSGPALLDAIRAAIKELPDQFNVKYVRRALYRAKPDHSFLTSTVSNALKKLADAGEIKLVMLGSGRRPSRYIKTRT